MTLRQWGIYLLIYWAAVAGNEAAGITEHAGGPAETKKLLEFWHTIKEATRRFIYDTNTI